MNDADATGRSETRTDTVWPLSLRALAATLDRPEPGSELPPLWHWMLFQDWPPTRALGADGHLRRGEFLPSLPDLPRRMWAGGRVAFHGVVSSGDAVTRTSTIQSVVRKSGGSGELVFVTVRHEIAGAAGVRIVEEQDIVYRAAAGPAYPPTPPAPAPTPRAGALVRSLRPTPVLLFRYSALTGNSHLIHYDLDYATRQEAYPGLVVHGPLQATLLAGLAVEAAAGKRLLRFTFRARRPAFHDRTLTLVAVRDGERVLVESRDDTGAICMDADATLA